MNGRQLANLASEARAEMPQLKRNLYETVKIDLEEKQAFYIRKRVDKILKPDP